MQSNARPGRSRSGSFGERRSSTAPRHVGATTRECRHEELATVAARVGDAAARGDHDIAHLELPTPDFDELESERFDLGKDSVECGLVREPAGEHRLAAILPG